MLPLEHSAILLTCIKRQSVLKTYFCVLFEWPLKTGFTVLYCRLDKNLLTNLEKNENLFRYQAIRAAILNI